MNVRSCTQQVCLIMLFHHICGTLLLIVYLSLQRNLIWKSSNVWTRYIGFLRRLNGYFSGINAIVSLTSSTVTYAWFFVDCTSKPIWNQLSKKRVRVATAWIYTEIQLHVSIIFIVFKSVVSAQVCVSNCTKFFVSSELCEFFFNQLHWIRWRGTFQAIFFKNSGNVYVFEV